MDLTPEVLRGMHFKKKGRGYDAEEVDAFRQGVESHLAEMQTRLREATAKLDEAETRAREAEERTRTNMESDETIQRTLLLAQRTADAAVKEAEETAARKVADAEAEADRLRNEARSHKDRAVAEAEADVQAAMDTKRAELLDELAVLERTRDAVADDVALLEVHLESERARLAVARDQLTRLLEDPGGLSSVATPTLSGASAPPPADAFGRPGDEVSADEGPVDASADRGEAAPGDEAEALADPWVAEAPVAAGEVSESGTGAWAMGPATDEPPTDPAAAPAAEASPAPPPPPPPPPPDLEPEDQAWAEAPPPPPPPPPPPDFQGSVDEAESAGTFGGLSGPAVPDLAEVDEADNPWLAELADEEAGADQGDRTRFGRRP